MKLKGFCLLASFFKLLMIMKKRVENIDFKQLLRYLEGKSFTKDAETVRRWLNDPSFENDLQEKSLIFWEKIPMEPECNKYNGAHILDKIYHRIKVDEAVFINRPKPINRFINSLTKIAATLFIPLLIASLILYKINNSSLNLQAYSEIYAPYGTRTDFYLPDGTTGRLNGGSTLKFPAQFGGKDREVKLSGEAFFNVVKNPKSPFIVFTENIDIKVHGTEFNVLAYPEEDKTEVTLVKGEVEVFKKRNNKAESIGILKPSETCIYSSKSDFHEITVVNTVDELSWMEGKLSFKYEPFEDVVRKINRWYNVNMVIKDKVLNTYTYYGTFKDETLNEVLMLLQLTAPIRYVDFNREQNQDGTYEKRKIELYHKIE